MISFFLGATAGVVVVVWNSLWKMIRSSVLKGVPQALAFATTVGLLFVWDVNPFIALAAGGLVSILGGRFLPGGGRAS